VWAVLTACLQLCLLYPSCIWLLDRIVAKIPSMWLGLTPQMLEWLVIGLTHCLLPQEITLHFAFLSLVQGHRVIDHMKVVHLYSVKQLRVITQLFLLAWGLPPWHASVSILKWLLQIRHGRDWCLTDYPFKVIKRLLVLFAPMKTLPFGRYNVKWCNFCWKWCMKFLQVPCCPLSPVDWIAS